MILIAVGVIGLATDDIKKGYAIAIIVVGAINLLRALLGTTATPTHCHLIPCLNRCLPGSSGMRCSLRAIGRPAGALGASPIGTQRHAR